MSSERASNPENESEVIAPDNSSRKDRLILWPFILLLPLMCLGHILSQQPKLSLNSQQFGLILLKGGYRSWFLSFCDGYTVVDASGKLKAVHLVRRPSGGLEAKPGYRWIPRFSHVDVREWTNLLRQALPQSPVMEKETP